MSNDFFSSDGALLSFNGSTAFGHLFTLRSNPDLVS